MTAFTVLIPTHDHADTLWCSVQSVLNQTVQDFELLIVGDGAPDRTGQIVSELAQRDGRIRYMPFPKGERHGEAHRHRALQSAVGRFVCYQADDDLWFPDHLEIMGTLLADHDLAHTMSLQMSPEGRISTIMFDAQPGSPGRERMRRLQAGFGLASGGHTMEAYRRLPEGWRPAPQGINTDLYFWLQFLDQPEFSYASHKWPTVLHLSSVTRAGWSSDRRFAELSFAASQVSDSRWREAVVRRALLPVHEQLLDNASRAANTISDAFAAYTVLGPDRYEQAALPLAKYRLGDRIVFGSDGLSGRTAVGLYPAGALHAVEAWGTWLYAQEIAIVLPMEKIGERDLLLSIELAHFIWPGGRDESRVWVAVGETTLLDIHEARSGPQLYECKAPAALHRNAPFLTIRLGSSKPLAPGAVSDSSDQRLLSVGLVSLTVSVE